MKVIEPGSACKIMRHGEHRGEACEVIAVHGGGICTVELTSGFYLLIAERDLAVTHEPWE